MSRGRLSRRRAEAVCVCLLLTGCKRRDRKVRVVQTDEDSASLASVIHMSDPSAAAQLLKGFHAIEEKSWRWTMGEFAIVLRPPRNAAAKGATLHFKFTLPEAVLAKVKPVSLSASVNGTALPPATYTQAGELGYSRAAHDKLLSGDAVNLEFKLDKFLPAGPVETRELGVS